MPPFRKERGIEQCWNGEALQALWDIGHGRRINIVDASYDIPDGARIIRFPGSSADALLGVVRLIPIEDDFVTIMLPDADHKSESHPTSFMAMEAFENVADRLREQEDPIELDVFGGVYRNDDVHGGSEPGFYTLASNPAEKQLFVRTIDDLPFACASLVAGHSQRTV